MDKRELLHTVLETLDNGSLDDDVIVRNLNDEREEDGDRLGDYNGLHLDTENGTLVIGIYGPPMGQTDEELDEAVG